MIWMSLTDSSCDRASACYKTLAVDNIIIPACLTTFRHPSFVLFGMTIEESARELNQLEHFAEQAGTRYVHEWQLGDVVVWDNRSVQHRAASKATV
eukprot:COSAG02_NODE_33627_length_497_cov_0.912060_1_plen_95_part_10